MGTRLAVASVALAATLGLSSPCANAQATYRFTGLGVAGSVSSGAFGLNDRGDVAGQYTVPGETGGQTRAAVWLGASSVVDLGAGGARGINDRGQSVGFQPGFQCAAAGCTAISSAVRWDGTAVATLGRSPSPSGAVNSFASAINGAGQVAGFEREHVIGNFFVFQPTLWSPDGAPTRLASFTSGVGSIALAINGQGHAAGEWFTASRGPDPLTPTGEHAVLWRDGQVLDLHVPGALSSGAFGINDRDQVVGSVSFATRTQAVVWNGNDATFLQDPVGRSSVANDINNRGEIVGDFFDPAIGRPSAAKWEDGLAIDLNTLLRPQTVAAGWHLDSAVAINEQGWIVGFASNARLGVFGEAYLLSLSDEPDRFLNLTPVPEPPTALLMAAGIGWVCAMRRRAVRDRSSAR